MERASTTAPGARKLASASGGLEQKKGALGAPLELVAADGREPKTCCCGHCLGAYHGPRALHCEGGPIGRPERPCEREGLVEPQRARDHETRTAGESRVA